MSDRSAKPRRGKKRPRVFSGTQSQCRQKELAQSVQEDPESFDLPSSVASHSYKEHVNKELAASNAAVLAEQLACAEELRELHAKGKLFVPPRY